jgi:hypothetical protein
MVFRSEKNRLSYLPAKGLHDPNSARTIIPLLDRLIAVTGVPGKPIRNLRFYGLEYEVEFKDFTLEVEEPTQYGDGK